MVTFTRFRGSNLYVPKPEQSFTAAFLFADGSVPSPDVVLENVITRGFVAFISKPADADAVAFGKAALAELKRIDTSGVLPSIGWINGSGAKANAVNAIIARAPGATTAVVSEPFAVDAGNATISVMPSALLPLDAGAAAIIIKPSSSSVGVAVTERHS